MHIFWLKLLLSTLLSGFSRKGAVVSENINKKSFAPIPGLYSGIIFDDQKYEFLHIFGQKLLFFGFFFTENNAIEVF